MTPIRDRPKAAFSHTPRRFLFPRLREIDQGSVSVQVFDTDARIFPIACQFEAESTPHVKPRGTVANRDPRKIKGRLKPTIVPPSL